jgi:hypothetical protein
MSPIAARDGVRHDKASQCGTRTLLQHPHLFTHLADECPELIERPLHTLALQLGCSVPLHSSTQTKLLTPLFRQLLMTHMQSLPACSHLTSARDSLLVQMHGLG